MRGNITYGKYVNGNLELHKINSIYKLLSFILMLFVCFFVNSYIDMIILFSYLLLCIAYSDIRIKVYVKELSVIKVLLLIILIIDIITLSSIKVLLCDIFRVIFIFMYFSIIMKCTAFNEIIYGVSKILKSFSKINSNMILNICLVFKFPYTFLKVRDKYYLINNNKCYDIKSKIIKYKDDMVRIFDLSIKELTKEERALKNKLYGYGKSRTNYRLSKFGTKEVIFVILNALILLIVMYYK